MDWLFQRPWVDPILMLLALLTAVIVLGHFIHRR